MLKKFSSLALLVWFLTACGSTTPISSSTVPSQVTTAAVATNTRPAVSSKTVIVAMTTSIEDSGLLDVIVPAFESKTGYKIKSVAVGSGQALALAQKGEVDALFVNAPESEKKILASGEIINRKLVMHNDFVIVGPAADKAGIRGKKDALEALSLIAKSQSPFISRGDDSGTDQLEKGLWKLTGIKPTDTWYKESGAGMAQTLKITDEKLAYTIADRATYIYQKKNLSLEVLVEGDTKLLNFYHVIETNSARFPRANQVGAKAFSDFLLSSDFQAVIAAYGKDKYGQPLFYIDGGKAEKDYGL